MLSMFNICSTTAGQRVVAPTRAFTYGRLRTRCERRSIASYFAKTSRSLVLDTTDIPDTPPYNHNDGASQFIKSAMLADRPKSTEMQPGLSFVPYRLT